MNQPVAGERESNSEKKPARVRRGWRELDGRPVRSGPVRFGPRFPAREQRSLIRQTLGRHQALESRQPVFIVARAVVWFPAPGSGLQFLGETGSPLFPGEISLFGEFHREREGLRLPRLSEDWPAFIMRQTRKVQ